MESMPYQTTPCDSSSRIARCESGEKCGGDDSSSENNGSPAGTPPPVPYAQSPVLVPSSVVSHFSHPYHHYNLGLDHHHSHTFFSPASQSHASAINLSSSHPHQSHDMSNSSERMGSRAMPQNPSDLTCDWSLPSSYTSPMREMEGNHPFLIKVYKYCLLIADYFLIPFNYEKNVFSSCLRSYKLLPATVSAAFNY